MRMAYISEFTLPGGGKGYILSLIHILVEGGGGNFF